MQGGLFMDDKEGMSDSEYYKQYKDRQNTINRNFNHVPLPKDRVTKHTKTKIGWGWIFATLLISVILWYVTGALDIPMKFLFVSIPITTITTTKRTTYYRK